MKGFAERVVTIFLWCVLSFAIMPIVGLLWIASKMVDWEELDG